MRVQGPKDLGILYCFPQAVSEVEQLGLEPASLWDAGISDGGFTHYAMMSGTRMDLSEDMDHKGSPCAFLSAVLWK